MKKNARKAFQARAAKKIHRCFETGKTAVAIRPNFSTGFRDIRKLELKDNELELGEVIPTPEIDTVEEIETFCKKNNLIIVGKITAMWFGGIYGGVLENLRPYK